MIKICANSVAPYTPYSYDPATTNPTENWLSGALIKIGRLCAPGNGYLYEATVEGTTNTAEPTWPTTIGNTVTDGGVTWKCIEQIGGPISVSATLDGSGGTVDTTIVTAYLVATRFGYTTPAVQPISEESGIDWKISVDGGNTWLDTHTFTDIDARSSDVVQEVRIKAVIINDKTLGTGTYTLAKVQTSSIENV